jgi:hypothetical protein
MTMEGSAVVLVHSAGHAIQVERLLKREGVGCKLIPIPRLISSDCGVCLRISRDDIAAVRAALAAGKIQILEIVEI